MHQIRRWRRRLGIQLYDAEHAVVELGTLVKQVHTPEEIKTLLSAFKAARSDVDYVYWLDPLGILRNSWPTNQISLGTEFEPPDVVQRALTSNSPVFEVGIAAETTYTAGVIIAAPVRASNGQLIGIVAVSLSLIDLSEPLQSVVGAQERSFHRRLIISVIDSKGELIATPHPQHILETVLDELPGAEQALQGQTVSLLGPGPDGQEWLFSAVPVPDAGWAVGFSDQPARPWL
ncbi:MAG TPA: cache domain-containing protein [Ktedonobacteraceae bacterium]